jgi:hypothetical protein
MTPILDVKPNSLVGMEPLELMKFLRSEIDTELFDSLDTDAERKAVVTEMNRLTSYIVYFTEMETFARNAKRTSKRNHESKEETERLLGVEEVFGTYKEMCQQLYTQHSKLMTMKRLMLDEVKLMGKTV